MKKLSNTHYSINFQMKTMTTRPQLYPITFKLQPEFHYLKPPPGAVSQFVPFLQGRKSIGN